MAFQPPHRDKIPSMKRRCHTHDYRSVSYYMITLGKNPAYTAPFCRIFDAALNPPDFTSARRRSDELTPGIKRILLPRNASVRDKAGTAGSSVPGAPAVSLPASPPGAPAVPLPAVELSDSGAFLRAGFRDFFRTESAILLKKIVVMPDHVHFIIHVREYLPTHLGRYISRLKTVCTLAVSELPGYPVDTDGNPLHIFEDNYHDRIIRNDSMLETERRYLDDNPRRYLLRKQHPEYFSSPVRITINGEHYSAFGNILLLKDIHPEPAIISRRYTPEHLSRLKAGWEEAARSRKALVSPFISKPEKEIKKAVLESGGRIIEILDNGFPERYKPSGTAFDLCLEGRLLQIAPLVYETSKIPLTRNRALELNATARQIAALAATPAAAGSLRVGPLSPKPPL
ncbi:hypothetical protein IMSAGC016_00599 [Muribaculaceae bacterium]|nr:hypothetical protein IMSAGC016_00599 [Muribaculaceae bacterium]